MKEGRWEVGREVESGREGAIERGRQRAIKNRKERREKKTR